MNSLYDRDFMLRCGERLLKSEGAYWDFYPKESVETLLVELERTGGAYNDRTGASRE